MLAASKYIVSLVIYVWYDEFKEKGKNKSPMQDMTPFYMQELWSLLFDTLNGILFNNEYL